MLEYRRRRRARQGDALPRLIKSTIAGMAGNYVERKVRNAVSSRGPIPNNQAPSEPLKGKLLKRRNKRHKKCPKSKMGKKVCKIENQMRDLKFSENASLGTMIYRRASKSALTCGVGAQGVGIYTGNSKTHIETSLALLKYYNPATPGTLTTADFSTGSYQRQVLIKQNSSSLLLRNNYQQDAHVKVYLCVNKGSTSTSPLTAWAAGIADQTSNGPAGDYTDQYQYLTDYQVVKDLYQVKKVLDTNLSPGQSAKVSHSVQDFEFDPSYVDVQTNDFQKVFKSWHFIVVLEGTLAHDTTLTQYETSQAGLDILYQRKYVISYDAGVNIKFIYLDNTQQSFTNGGVQSHQPVSDNIGYSVA